jgi:hypothetical protein
MRFTVPTTPNDRQTSTTNAGWWASEIPRPTLQAHHNAVHRTDNAKRPTNIRDQFRMVGLGNTSTHPTLLSAAGDYLMSDVVSGGPPVAPSVVPTRITGAFCGSHP